MKNRIRQLLSAVFAEITEADKSYLANNLSVTEQKLFYGMDIPTQRHSLNVAKTAETLIQKGDFPNLNTSLLIKGTLLHDTGKKVKDISTADKILIVIIEIFYPQLLKIYGKEGRGHGLDNIRHAFFVHTIHPQRGAQIATDAGLDPELVNLIKKHHDPIKSADKIELKLLIEADQLN
jgi:putative nucleotidyltransferase with HDIG domain